MGREQRQNPRWPNSGIWGERERQEHRRERDRIIREAGLDPGPTDDGPDAEADVPSTDGGDAGDGRSG